jgi:hypothetical protein
VSLETADILMLWRSEGPSRNMAGLACTIVTGGRQPV